MSHDVKLNFIRIDLTQKINSLHRLVGCSALLITNRAMGLNLYFELYIHIELALDRSLGWFNCELSTSSCTDLSHGETQFTIDARPLLNDDFQLLLSNDSLIK